MKKLQFYASIALLSFTMFSCADKSSWTPEVEAEFKKAAKEEIANDPENPFSDEQATTMVDCMTDKIKKQGIKPDDVEKTENEAILTKIAMECAKESLKK